MITDPGMSARLDRRTFLIGVGAAAAFLVAGCATFRRSSDLDAAFDDLETLLKQTDGVDTGHVMDITERIRAKAQKLVETHESFISDFNEMAIDTSRTSGDLRKLAGDYESERLAVRNDLLHLQDNLHAALPEDAWPEVLDKLNRKSSHLAGTGLAEG